MSLKDSLIKTYSYDVKIKEYSNGLIEFVKYSRPIYTQVKTDTKPQKRSQRAVNKTKATEYRQDSLNRSYGLLMDYAIQNANNFKTFITLTFKDNITDLDYANKQFNNSMRSIKRIYPTFMYLGVPEFQKRGAVHYHIMTNLKTTDTKVIQKQENKKDMYDIKQWVHGYSSVFDLSLTDDKFSVAAYLTKYFYKDISTRLIGRKKILKSQNLDKPNEKHFRSNSNELQNYQNYLTKYKTQTKKKYITATNSYAPDLAIYHFKDK